MKKRSLLFVFCIFSIISYSQELPTYNFKIEDGRLIWQKTFETSLNFQGLFRSIKMTGAIDKPDTLSNQISGDLKQMMIDFKGAGKTSASTWMVLLSSNLLGYAIIDYKEGKYRITIKNMTLYQVYNDPLTRMGQITPIEKISVKKDEIKSGFLKQGAEVLDYSINKTFSLDAIKKTDTW